MAPPQLPVLFDGDTGWQAGKKWRLANVRHPGAYFAGLPGRKSDRITRSTTPTTTHEHGPSDRLDRKNRILWAAPCSYCPWRRPRCRRSAHCRRACAALAEPRERLVRERRPVQSRPAQGRVGGVRERGTGDVLVANASPYATHQFFRGELPKSSPFLGPSPSIAVAPPRGSATP